MAVTQLFDKYSVCGKTDCGRAREHNEDALLINKNSGTILLADGMGGYLYGDKASFETTRLVDQLIDRYLPLRHPVSERAGFWRKLTGLFGNIANTEQQQMLALQCQLIGDILLETNQAIYELNLRAGLNSGERMGTTLVGCKLHPEAMSMPVFHVGDSRLYCFRNGRLAQITKDHSLYQLWLDNGGMGERPGSHAIWQAIGPDPDISPDIQWVDVLSGDTFLLCSDGLSNMVDDAEIGEVLADCNRANIEEKTQQLIDMANQNGGKDNISVILIHLQ
ncbi:MAG: serine/threonine-protein phosphatase [Methylomicrobium sp.]